MTDHALQLLNDLQQGDPTACAELVSHRVAAPESIATRKDFLCQTARGGKAMLSVLGLINSLLLKNGNSKVAAIVDDDGTVIGFTKHVVTKSPALVNPAPAKA